MLVKNIKNAWTTIVKGITYRFDENEVKEVPETFRDAFSDRLVEVKEVNYNSIEKVNSLEDEINNQLGNNHLKNLENENEILGGIIDKRKELADISKKIMYSTEILTNLENTITEFKSEELELVNGNFKLHTEMLKLISENEKLKEEIICVKNEQNKSTSSTIENDGNVNGAILNQSHRDVDNNVVETKNLAKAEVLTPKEIVEKHDELVKQKENVEIKKEVKKKKKTKKRKVAKKKKAKV